MKLRPAFLFITAVFIVRGLAAAETDSPTAEVATASNITAVSGSDLLTIDYPNHPIGTILADVARAARINLVIETPIQGRTSIKLRNVTWRQIFREALSPVGYTYVESDGLVRVISLWRTSQPWTPDLLFPAPDNGTEPKIGIHFDDAPASEVLREIARQSGVPLVIPFPLEHRVTVHLENTTWRPAFRAVLNSHGYTFSEGDTEDDVVTIRPRPDLPELANQTPGEPSIQTLWDNAKLLATILAVSGLALVHLCFAVGVARRRLGRPARFLPKWLWVILVLGGGLLPLLGYWLMHESRLATAPSIREPQT